MTKYNAYLKGWLWVPYPAVADLDRMREQLKFQPRRKMDGTKPDPVRLYYDDPERKMIAVPQAWGLENFGPYVDVVDQTTEGEPMLNPGSPPEPRDDRQADFMNQLLTRMQTDRTFLAMAPTGSGKTVSSLWAACQHGRKTVILVHLERLQAQWVKHIQDHLGVPRSNIGTVTGDKADWRGKDYVVAMMPSVAQQVMRYGKEFYESFGVLIVDEVHRTGAPTFSQSIWQFPARVRVGLSATMKRKDGAERIIHYHIGKVLATSDQEALPMEVWPVWYETQGKLWGDNHGTRMKCLSQDYKRNQRIVSLIKRMYDGGRQAIIVGEGVEHLQLLMRMSVQAGIPENVMGQFTSMVHENKQVRAGNRLQTVKKNRKQKKAVLAKILRESQLTYATYGMIKEGIDVPRWDAGIDVTPRSDATQLIGRVRRPHPGKKDPVLWVTLVDAACDRSLRYYQTRLQEYQASGATVMNRS